MDWKLFLSIFCILLSYASTSDGKRVADAIRVSSSKSGRFSGSPTLKELQNALDFLLICLNDKLRALEALSLSSANLAKIDWDPPKSEGFGTIGSGQDEFFKRILHRSGGDDSSHAPQGLLGLGLLDLSAGLVNVPIKDVLNSNNGALSIGSSGVTTIQDVDFSGSFGATHSHQHHGHKDKITTTGHISKPAIKKEVDVVVSQSTVVKRPDSQSVPSKKKVKLGLLANKPNEHKQKPIQSTHGIQGSLVKRPIKANGGLKALPAKSGLIKKPVKSSHSLHGATALHTKINQGLVVPPSKIEKIVSTKTMIDVKPQKPVVEPIVTKKTIIPLGAVKLKPAAPVVGVEKTLSASATNHAKPKQELVKKPVIGFNLVTNQAMNVKPKPKPVAIKPSLNLVGTSHINTGVKGVVIGGTNQGDKNALGIQQRISEDLEARSKLALLARLAALASQE